jgi:hypothetical protein
MKTPVRVPADSKCKRFKVSPWHGEGASHFHIVDCWAPDGEQPAILITCDRRETADWICNLLNPTHFEP